MRQRFTLGAVLATALVACGGSSSETPPPLQPDPHGFHYGPTPLIPSEPSDAGNAPASRDLDDDEKPGAAARSTWGSPAPSKR